MINKDKEVDKLIRKAMPDVNMLYDWELDYRDKNSKKEEKRKVFKSEEILINVIKRIQDDKVYRQELIDTDILTNDGMIKKKLLKKISNISNSSWKRAIKTPLFKQFCSDKNIKIDNKHSIKI